MIASICLISCAWLGQATNRAEWQLAPQLATGLELVYQGTFLDESLIPNVQHQKQFRLEANMLVLEARARDAQVAFLTSLSMQDTRQPFNHPLDGATSVRLEMASVDPQGRVRTLDKKPLLLPLQGPPTLECGFLIAAPFGKVGRQSTWEVSEAGRPDQRWQIAGTEACGGITCIKVVGVQQSEDWESSRADRTAWRRRDTLWILPPLGVAQKVERILEYRDPARVQPTHRTTVRYELDSRPKWPANLFEDRRKELLAAKKYYDDVESMALRPALYRPQIETMLQRVSAQIEQPTSTHYRKAFVHIKSLLEEARRGEGRVPHPVEEPMAVSVKPLLIGQRAPNFAVSCLSDHEPIRLQAYQGKPVLIVFFNPATPMGQDVLGFAKQLSEKQPKNLAIMAMAVTYDTELTRKQHRDMQLSFPILDGNGMRLTFGVEQTPRIVLLDSNGYVRMAQTGWGFQTPLEIHEELQRCSRKER